MTFTCDETNRMLKSGTQLPMQALAHIAGCELCQSLVDLATDSATDNASKREGEVALDVLWNELERDIAKERGLLAWLRDRASPARWTAAACFALIPAAAMLAFARRTDIQHYPAPRFLVTAGMLVLVTAAVAKVQLAPLYLRQANWRRGLTIGLGLALPVVVAALAPAYDQAVDFPIAAQRFWAKAWICMRFGLLLAAPAVWLLFALDRQTVRSSSFAAALGAVGGLAANLLLFIHCPIEQPGHQLVGHAAIGLVFWCVVTTVTLAFRKRHSRRTQVG